MHYSLPRTILTVGIFLLATTTTLKPCFPQNRAKPTLEEVLARHLASIGTPEARAAVKSRVAQGSVVATIRVGGTGQSKGGAVMASQGVMSLIGIIFGPQEYSNEKMAFDGKKLTVGEWKPGVRTHLGGFLLNHDIMFKEGLIGGTLSTAWPLLDLSLRNPKLRYAGLKKFEGRQLHILDYEPRSGGNLDIKLYFDSETFQHLRTEYTQDFSPPAVSRPEDAARQKETHLKLTEEFSDYRQEAGLNLPHVYKLQLTIDSSTDSVLQDWVLTLKQFLFNKELDPKQFDLNIR